MRRIAFGSALLVLGLVVASCAGDAVVASTTTTPSTTTAPTTTVPPTTSMPTIATTLPMPETFELTVGGDRRDRGVGITMLADGGYAVVGHTSSPPAQGQDAYLVRLDPFGNVLWERVYGGSGQDAAWAVVERPDGGLLVFGFTSSTGAGGFDMYLVSTDEDGNPVSERTFGGPGDEYGWALAPTADGGVLVAGETESFGAGDVDGYVISIGPDGEERWTSTIGGAGEDRLFSIVATDDGGAVLTGTTTTDSLGSRDAYLVGLDEEGTVAWEHRFGGEGDDVGHSVRPRSAGGYLVAGYTESFGSESYDAWAIAIDPNGELVWDTRYGDARDDRTISGEEMSDGGYVLTGYTKSYDAVDWDVFVVRLDPHGTVLWHRLFGGRGSDTGYTVISTGDGFILTGETSSVGVGGEMYVIKADADGHVEASDG